jgi:hypothetical protein
MKNVIKNIIVLIIVLAALPFALSSCYETQYYHSYNHHTRGWYERRHTPPPAGVNFEVDIQTRHHHRH